MCYIEMKQLCNAPQWLLEEHEWGYDKAVVLKIDDDGIVP